MVVCKYFQQGRCQYGDQCKFEHVMQGAPSSGFMGGNTFGAPQQQAGAQFGAPQQFGAPSQAGGSAFAAGMQQQQQQQQQPSSFGQMNGGPGGQQPQQQFGGAFGQNPAQQQQRGGYRGGYRGGDRGRGGPGTYRGRGGFSNRGGYMGSGGGDSARTAALIKEDLQKGTPLWPLTCYGRDLDECIVLGDVAPEELRAEAYAAVLQGATAQQVIEHETQRVKQQTEKFHQLMQQCNTMTQNQPPPMGSNQFGQPAQNQGSTPFGMTQPQPATSPFGGVQSSQSPFGQSAPTTAPAALSPFGATGGSPFGGAVGQQQPQQQPQQPGSSGFGTPSQFSIR
eukprot:CAMPEP_0184692002 /NCGR_PEP_ID=MMETSP0313-20130426/659_1 /TAXON_ID=2792 /ORGANISM="Porphyridium aerugineum, Strain SAG 1380-2" /LENGTH=336 /DNA_ID=CAMNT_0027149795 /DNA_START=360 /DNA_END=1370 /DNA_ORIENTATION=-